MIKIRGWSISQGPHLVSIVGNFSVQPRTPSFPVHSSCLSFPLFPSYFIYILSAGEYFLFCT
ncbi:hypothetical protein BDV34DRAFT_7564 [Aspergillus parasiticus]|uniref:Uncharacterized protein n=1 Tax=Aspergillus parasiticus TaxID=5067 RepID=A0A5N6DXH0_ASPPA|nr:hypothetical protein BDV34DRAFT_7564 [Aspergillus parasiticus]